MFSKKRTHLFTNITDRVSLWIDINTFHNIVESFNHIRVRAWCGFFYFQVVKNYFHMIQDFMYFLMQMLWYYRSGAKTALSFSNVQILSKTLSWKSLAALINFHARISVEIRNLSCTRVRCWAFQTLAFAHIIQVRSSSVFITNWFDGSLSKVEQANTGWYILYLRLIRTLI